MNASGEDQRNKAIQILLGGSFSLNLNMNDTFGFACADCETFDVDDLEPMIPLINRYGRHALTAYVAVKRKEEPIHCSCNHDGPEYRAARKEIEKIYAENEYFMLDTRE